MAYLDWLSVLLFSMVVRCVGTVAESERVRNYTVNGPEGFLFGCSSFVERHVSDAFGIEVRLERNISLTLRVQGLSSTVWVSGSLQAAS